MKLKPIRDQVVVLMGASSGIGRETALKFAEKGAKLALSARSEEGLNSLAEEIRQRGGQSIFIPAEVSDFDQVKAVADRAAVTYGHIDTWVHLSGVHMTAPFEQTTAEEFRRIVDVNLNGAAFGAMAALPYLKRENGAALIGVSSVEARVGLPYSAAYAASKHGVEGFLDVLRLELKREGANVSVTNVMPSTINTPLFTKARTKIGVKPKGLSPIYDPKIVADAILYAAEHPVRDIFAGGAGFSLSVLHRLSPRLSDAVLGRIGFTGQHTNQPKTDDAPHNLYDHIPYMNRVQGDFISQTRRRSLYTWMAVHPALGALLTGTALGSLGWMAATRGLKRRAEPYREPLKASRTAS